MKKTIVKSTIISFVIFILAAASIISCKGGKSAAPSEEEKVLELSRRIMEMRKQVDSVKELESSVGAMEKEIISINENLKKRDPVAAAVNAISFAHVTVVQIPEILDSKRKISCVEFGYVGFRVAGLMDDLMNVFENIRSSSELEIETAEIAFGELPDLTTLSVIASYPTAIDIGESLVATSENSPTTEESQIATQEDKVKKLEKILNALSLELKKKDALEKRRKELEEALKVFENRQNDIPDMSHFIRNLPVRWPIGLPALKTIKIQQNVISIWTQGYLDEINPFILETYEELSKVASPAVLNFNPLIPNIDGKNLEEKLENGKIILSWKGLPVYSTPAEDVLTMVKTTNTIYIITPQEKISGEKRAPASPVRSIRAVAVVSRATLWEKFLNGARISNIILNSSGGLLYADAEKIFCLNAETGEKLGETALQGRILELAVGANDKLIVKTKKEDDSQAWVTIQAPCR